MEGLTGILLWVIVTVSVGFNLLVLFDRHKSVRGIEAAGVSFLLGIGVISLEMFLVGACGARFSRTVILAPWIILMAYNLFFSRQLLSGRFNTPLGINLSGALKNIIFALLSLQVAYTFFRAFIKPMESYDSVSINALKAKILFLFGTIPPGFFNPLLSSFHGAHPDYPLLVSLSETWVYVFLSSFNDFSAKCIFPLIFLAFLAVFYSFLAKILKKGVSAILFTFALASIAQFNAYATIGTSDLPMGIYFCLSLAYLYLWFRDTENNAYFCLSLVFSVLSLWTKNEGTLLVFINILLLVLFVLRNLRYSDTSVKWRAFFYILIAGLAIFSWAAYKRSMGLVNENFNFSMVNVSNLMAGIKRIPVILYEYQKHVFGFKKWNIIWLIMLAFAFGKPRQAFSGDMLYVTTAIVSFFAAYSLVYMLSDVEIHFLLRTTASRFLLHILPVCVFWIAAMADRLEWIWEK